MWNVRKRPVERIYLPDGRVLYYSDDSTDQNLFALWLSESMR